MIAEPVVVALVTAAVFGVVYGAWVEQHRRRAERWRVAATSCARVVRALDAWPLVEHGGGGAGLLADLFASGGGEPVAPRDPFAPGARTTIGGMALVPIPPTVAVVGRDAALERWSASAARALAAIEALAESEGRR